MCEKCGDGLESVAHYILRCPHYASERYIHLESNGPDYTCLDFLFSEPEALLPLLDYLKATGRFVDTFR